MGLKYHKIFTHDHINARELSEVYTSDSSDHGRLFIILELPKQKTDQQPSIDQLINEVATYFDNPSIKPLIHKTSNQENQLVINQLINITHFIRKLGLIFSAVFIVISILIIFNTIRLAIYSRKDEIEIMKFVCAHSVYPFSLFVKVFVYSSSHIAIGVGVPGKIFTKANPLHF